MLRPALQKAAAGSHLSREEAAHAIAVMLSGDAVPAQMAALLIALRMKGETPDEIVGAALALRRRALAVDVPDALRAHLVDTCGTGGDGAHTFNISTAAAFVAAAAGATVAKHGNRAVSSNCGSADVLAALGVELELSPRALSACLEQCGMAFLFAPRHHAAMRHVAPVRKELGLRTLFNLLGPLANPAGAQRQLLGVYAPELLPVIARALAELGCVHAIVVHGAGGLDEISTEGESRIAELRGGVVREWSMHPESVGVEAAPRSELRGGDAQENAALLRAVLEGEVSARRTAVLLNAGAALCAAGICETIGEGVERAKASIDSGAARERLARLVRVSHEEMARDQGASGSSTP